MSATTAFNIAWIWGCFMYVLGYWTGQRRLLAYMRKLMEERVRGLSE